jgi:arabinofuranosyltransferase
MKKQIKRFVPVALLLFVFLAVLIRNAWVTDDAYITFRVIENFLHKYGLVYNVSYRVQSYTHPLWMFMLTFLYYIVMRLFGTPVWGGLYDLSLMLSIVLSFSTGVLLSWRIARSGRMAFLGLLVLIFSKAFIDYTTSGLENPLTYALIALFMLVYLNRKIRPRERLFLLSLTAALATLNRMDTLVLFLPVLVYEFWLAENKRQALGQYVLGFTPFIAWEIFSLIYYGFLVPNTAYAKLSSGAARIELLRQGYLFLLNSLSVDPLTLVVIGFGILLPLLYRKWKRIPLALGILLYVTYVVYIGGDFMSGRFLAAPLLMAVCLITQFRLDGKKTFNTLAVMVAVLGLISPSNPLLSDSTYGYGVTNYKQVADQNRVTDERAFYYQTQGLLRSKRTTERTAGRWVWDAWKISKSFPEVKVINAIGRAGYNAGPDMVVVDLASLADPLLARLPIGNRVFWIIGHFNRGVPEGYLDTLKNGANQIEDPALRQYYDKLHLIISGDVWDGARWEAIWKMNTGQYDYLIEQYVNRDEK